MPTCKGGINMKRLSKKLIALVMAMTMVLAMGVTSFAAENDADYTVSVTIIDQTGASVTKNVEVDDESSYSDYTEIENNGSATAFDAIKKAVNHVMTYHKVQYVQYNSSTDTWDPIDQYGFAIDSVNGTSGYYDSATGEYHYWELLINGSVAENYATYYTLDNVNYITLRWATY